MTATTLRPRPTAPAAVSEEGAAGRLRARRQPKWIAAGVLAMCVGGLGAAVLWSEAAGSADVLVLTRTVGRGEVVQAEDFRVAQVGHLDGVSTVEATALSRVVGQQALVDLTQGALLPAGGVGSVALDAGGVQVGLRLAPGRLPLGELPTGTPVLLVALADPRAQAEAPGDSIPPVAARVLTPPRSGPDGVAQLLDVRVEAPEAAHIAALAATDRLVLVKEGH